MIYYAQLTELLKLRALTTGSSRRFGFREFSEDEDAFTAVEKEAEVGEETAANGDEDEDGDVLGLTGSWPSRIGRPVMIPSEADDEEDGGATGPKLMILLTALHRNFKLEKSQISYEICADFSEENLTTRDKLAFSSFFVE